MTTEKALGTQIQAVRPPVESLLWDKNESLWPKEILSDSEFTRLITIRTKLSFVLRKINIETKNQKDLWQCVRAGIIDSETLISFYEYMTRFVEADPIHRRIILYLPFEYVPSYNDKSNIQKLNDAKNKFLEVYKKTWKALLKDEDNRVDFTDGDNPGAEIENAPLPRVVKAGHMIPILVTKGVLECYEIIRMIHKDELYDLAVQSVVEGIYALVALDKTYEWALSFKHPIFEKYVQSIGNSSPQQKTFERYPANTLHDEIILGVEAVELQYAERLKNVPASRANWELHTDITFLVERYGEHILYNRELTEIALFVTNAHTSVLKMVAVTTIEKLLTNKKIGFDFFEETLIRWWNQKDAEVNETIERLFLHTSLLGIISESKLEEIGVQRPELDGLINPNDMLQVEFNWIKDSIAKLESSPLAPFIEPVVILYGSKTKGYASTKADIDIAVFIKSNTPAKKLPFIRTELKKLFKHSNHSITPVQFWLDENEKEMLVRDFPKFEKDLGRSFYTHVILQGVWYGETNAMENLYRKLLVPFLFPQGISYGEKSAKDLWFSEIERDTLQYRLLHKGYRHSNPNRITDDMKELYWIDGNSTFWDPGYRKVATQLFVDRVFLPCLSK